MFPSSPTIEKKYRQFEVYLSQANCSHCGRVGAYLCPSCDYLHCVKCNERTVRVPHEIVRVALKAMRQGMTFSAWTGKPVEIIGPDKVVMLSLNEEEWLRVSYEQREQLLDFAQAHDATQVEEWLVSKGIRIRE